MLKEPFCEATMAGKRRQDICWYLVVDDDDELSADTTYTYCPTWIMSTQSQYSLILGLKEVPKYFNMNRSYWVLLVGVAQI